MARYFARIAGSLLGAAGLFGILVGAIPHFVQLDLWQSMLYFIFGFVGISLGWFAGSEHSRHRYVEVVTAVTMLLLLFGLTLPNFLDVFHLELPEHVFHAILFAYGVVTSAALKR